FTGSPQTAGALARWTVGFTPTATGALAAGDMVTASFAAGYVVPASPSVTLGAGFSSCTATAAGSSQTVTVTLAGASCSLPASTAAALTIGGITNPAAGTYTASGFTVKTSSDTAATAASSDVVIG